MVPEYFHCLKTLLCTTNSPLSLHTPLQLLIFSLSSQFCLCQKWESYSIWPFHIDSFHLTSYLNYLSLYLKSTLMDSI